MQNCTSVVAIAYANSRSSSHVSVGQLIVCQEVCNTAYITDNSRSSSHVCVDQLIVCQEVCNTAYITDNSRSSSHVSVDQLIVCQIKSNQTLFRVGQCKRYNIS
jgi:hypothetical protein